MQKAREWNMDEDDDLNIAITSHNADKFQSV